MVTIGIGDYWYAGPVYHGDYSSPYYGYPHVQRETTRGFLALHPTSLGIGAGVGYTFSETGAFRVQADFARANNWAAGNGVDVGIYLNKDFANPLFESTLPVSEDVKPDDLFSGLSSDSCDQIIHVSAGDQLVFVVFADSGDQDAYFDITALRGTIGRLTNPIEMLRELALLVKEINEIQGIPSTLDRKLDAAINALEDANENNDVAACNALEAFINHCEAQAGNKLTVEQAELLIAEAMDIVAVLCGS